MGDCQAVGGYVCGICVGVGVLEVWADFQSGALCKTSCDILACIGGPRHNLLEGVKDAGIGNTGPEI